jgi:hypothetical protein
MNMNWKELAEDLVLLEQLKKRFVEIGCTDDDAYTYATYLYMTNQPIIIRTTTISDNNNNR